MPDPRFTDDERALILRRAAELQQRQGDAVHALSELERDAAAAGIDPLLVRRVARELAPGAGAETDTRQDATSDARVVVRRRVEEARTPLASGAVLGAIRRHSPVLGEVRALGHGFEWRYDTGYSASSVVLTPSGAGGVDVEVTGRFEGRQIVMHLVPAAAAALATLGGLGELSGLAVAAIGAGTLAAGLTASRLLWRRVARREQGRLERMADAVADALAHDATSDDTPVLPREPR
ncbi:hypothetical protein [Roseisolibacter agri]|uniref:Uncharacterized protein n=1 Tax=Roseisolibacter agri TaxID=2014610 RepID=A0AA37VBA9_9BACT|nr:hypothetical protein [Roseisolibacter agri]GLC26233.1 hypothetical protein rosag_27460 [Roseisolibacter agri]